MKNEYNDNDDRNEHKDMNDILSEVLDAPPRQDPSADLCQGIMQQIRQQEPFTESDRDSWIVPLLVGGVCFILLLIAADFIYTNYSVDALNNIEAYQEWNISYFEYLLAIVIFPVAYLLLGSRRSEVEA
ncbi:MAG: hypothetical protein HRU15_13645 [Planctomycetes bacterium]|nr:hypothetical protein [Planctomycetota bacterium]